MKEQVGREFTKTRSRAKEQYIPPQRQSNPHRVGHQSGLHPEDEPYLTDDLEEDEEYYTTRLPTSVRRYDTFSDGQVIQKGNKRIIVHYGQPPFVRRRSLDEPNDKPRSRFHPLVYIGVFLIILIGGVLGLNALSAFWQQKQDDWTYGNPRTYQIDINVGHGSSQIPTSHFIALNLQGRVQVIEEPGDDASKARTYEITEIPGNSGNPPVKLVFQDLNRDGKLDMLVEIGEPGNFITIMLFNNGTQFVSKL